MLISVVLAIFAFALYYLYDYFSVVKPTVSITKYLFPIATLLIIVSTAYLLYKNADFFIGGFVGIVSLICAVICLGLTVWSLVFSLPEDTYVAPGERRPVYTGGAYSLCRHPGVFFYCLFYLFLFICFPCISTFVVFSTLCIGNVGYMIIQDVWTFPKLLEGYNDYKLCSNLFLPNFKKRK